MGTTAEEEEEEDEEDEEEDEEEEEEEEDEEEDDEGEEVVTVPGPALFSIADIFCTTSTAIIPTLSLTSSSPIMLFFIINRNVTCYLNVYYGVLCDVNSETKSVIRSLCFNLTSKLLIDVYILLCVCIYILCVMYKCVSNLMCTYTSHVMN